MRIPSLVLLLTLLYSGRSDAQSVADGTWRKDSVYLIRDSVLIPTRSGHSISLMVVRREGAADKLPAILFYTTYYQGPGDAIFGKRSADRDYAGIVAYARGIRTDISAYAPYEHEPVDVYDIIDWISKQDWCDGRVAMFGGSYTGYAQWAVMRQRHPALKTIVPQVAVMPGFDTPYENNVQTNNILAWPNDNIYKRPPLRRSLPFEWYEKGIAFARMDSLAGEANPIFRNWLAHPAYDNYWQQLVPDAAAYAKIDIPILSTTGYYDGAQIGALQYVRQHYRNNPAAEHYLVIGPWDHWGAQRRAAPTLMGYAIDSVARISLMELAYQWIDYVIKGKPRPALLQDRINFQPMGTNQWKHAASLEALSRDSLQFWLSDGNLVSKLPRKAAFSRQVVDMKDRKTENNFFTPEIIFDSLDASNGILFQSSPFEREVTLCGSFGGQIQLTTNKRDADISLALYELQADGRYFFLTRYVGRASYARDRTRRQLLDPGQSVLLPIGATRFVSKRIGKGSCLVVLLNTNKHPFEIINYGSGKAVADESIGDAGVPMELQWGNRSYISLPVCR
ncbi:putative hydrolase [Flavihumibacter petaseus NBRC 106054]|uniref:Putative hydrolase n=1 Tax=Flavihumibacter petaseus NBRC 106054 TaxID=1220578 RepID=A0A0E9N1R3_9BACT|nr:putative hydrolase [Flavihumibacter petaseus NBRC 106054]